MEFCVCLCDGFFFLTFLILYLYYFILVSIARLFPKREVVTILKKLLMKWLAYGPISNSVLFSFNVALHLHMVFTVYFLPFYTNSSLSKHDVSKIYKRILFLFLYLIFWRKNFASQKKKEESKKACPKELIAACGLDFLL